MRKRLLIRPVFAVLLAVIAVAGVLTVVLVAENESSEISSEMRNAAEIMENIEGYLKEDILSRGIAIEEEDLNRTALLGPEFTELTSTPGEVGAKRSALNPHFAAVMVRYFISAGLERGDSIAVSSSGSFPGFLIAVLSAAEAYGLDVYLTASVGASMHGATRVGYNIFDILKGIRESGLASFNLIGVSCGGANDQGGGVLEGILYEGTAELSLELCREAVSWSGAELIYHDSLASSIAEHLMLFPDDVGMFVNIGGASVNAGTSSYTLDFPQGLVLDAPPIPEGDEIGLNYEFAARGVPVLNLLNVKKLCQENNLPFDPVPLPTAESVDSTVSVSYSKPLIALFLSLFALVLMVAAADSLRRRRCVPASGNRDGS